MILPANARRESKWLRPTALIRAVRLLSIATLRVGTAGAGRGRSPSSPHAPLDSRRRPPRLSPPPACRLAVLRPEGLKWRESELSRCGRAIWEVLETIKFCADNGINLHFHKEGLTLFRDGKVDSIMAIYISCLGFCAEKERENIYFRLSQGRELAKAKGVKMGRKGESLRNVAKLCDVSLSSVQRVKKEFCL